MTMWLQGDLHCHCEDHNLIEALVEGVAGRLDFLALTNHAQKPIFFEQEAMVARIRELCPGMPVFFGMEWNGPVGQHINVIFPPSDNEARNAFAFARAHDRRISGTDNRIESAMRTLHDLPQDEQPILFFNHPGAQPPFLPEHLDAFHVAAGPRIFVGVEALHGHQAWEHVASVDALTYPGSCIGGLCDHMYSRGHNFALLAHSDFHVHKQSFKPDYRLGEFNRTVVQVEASRTTAGDIFYSIRAGRTCAAQQKWFDLQRITANEATLGETARYASAVRICVEGHAHEPLSRLDLIGSTGEMPRLLHESGRLEAGSLKIELQLELGGPGFVRLRAVAETQSRPPPGPKSPRLFLSSAVLFAGPPQ